VSPLAISSIVFAVVFGGALFGMVIRSFLPERHVTGESKDAIKSAVALIATLSALVAGLLIATAKTSYDAHDTQVKQLTANIILIDRLLALYGPEARDARDLLRRSVPPLADRISSENNLEPAKSVPFEMSAEAEAFYAKIQELMPQNDAQRSLQARAISSATALGQARLLLFAQAHDSIPTPFLATLVFWLAIIFASFSLFVRANFVVFIALSFCALACSGAIFLILEMDGPFSGLIAISSDPLRQALAPLGP
jgi:hypothetical protein